MDATQTTSTGLANNRCIWFVELQRPIAWMRGLNLPISRIYAREWAGESRSDNQAVVPVIISIFEVLNADNTFSAPIIGVLMIFPEISMTIFYKHARGCYLNHPESLISLVFLQVRSTILR